MNCITMYLPKEFRPLIVPQYRAVTRGEWSLSMKNVKGAPRKVLAYYRNGVQMPKECWVLMQNQTIWMSLTPMEFESQGYHGRMASGHVLVAGLGMGALVYHLLTHNPKVTKITVVELNPHVVDILKEATDWFVPSERLEIVIGDARQFTPTTPVDTLLVDIWPAIGRPVAESDTRSIQQNVRAKVVGWWGQELDLMSFVYNMGRSEPSQQDMRSYEEYLGFSVLGYTHTMYATMASAAAQNISRAMDQQERQQAKPVLPILPTTRDQATFGIERFSLNPIADPE